MPQSLLRKLITWMFILVFACVNLASTSAGRGSPVRLPPIDGNSETRSSARISSGLDKITPRLLAELDASEEADVLVFVRGRPDLTPAHALSSKKAKAQFVADALRATAERTQADLRAFLDTRDVAYQAFWVVNVLRLRGSRELVSQLSRRSEVDKVDINLRFGGAAPLPDVGPATDSAEPPTYPWGISDIDAPAVWERGVRGQGIVVAGADTGVDWNHEALIDEYRGWDGVSADHNYNWRDAWDKTPLEPSDDHSHGTHTLGTVAGGGPEHVGVAPGVRWIACRNMDSGYGTPAAYVDCFQFFLAPTDLLGENPRPDLAPHIVNNSWACLESEGCYPDDPLWEDTIEPAVGALAAAGIAVVASAGNGGPTCESIQDPPAIYPQSLSVGAVGEDSKAAHFSSRGPVSAGGGHQAPDLSAPGVRVLSSTPNDGYASFSGTSMAAPHVAGTIALLWSAEPQLIGRLAVTEQVLRASAKPVADNACGGDSDGQPNNVYGWGVINADAAVQTAESLKQLSGTVMDSDGRPLSGVEVKVVDLTWETEIDLRTEPDGGYGTPLLPGSYRVEIDTPAHFSASMVVTVSPQGDVVHNVALRTCIDWNQDGRTDLFEVSEIAGNWQNSVFDPKLDVNDDGVLNIVDLVTLTPHLNEPCLPD